jgi:hypothetical protein
VATGEEEYISRVHCRNRAAVGLNGFFNRGGTMIKSGIIVGAIAFVYLFVTNATMAICTPFEAVILGLMAGALAVVFDKPQLANKAALSGGVAGLIAAIFAVIGNVAGNLLKTYVIFTPETISSVGNQLTGMQTTGFDSTISTLSTFFSLGCCVITDLVLMVGLGVLGGYLWFRYKNKNAAPPPPQAVS